MCSACLFSFSEYFDLSPRGIVSSLLTIAMECRSCTAKPRIQRAGGRRLVRMPFSSPQESTIRPPHRRAPASISTLLPADRTVVHRRRLHCAHGHSVAGELFHGLALVRRDRFSDRVRDVADLANRAVCPGRRVLLRLLLRQRANRSWSRHRFPRSVRESRRWRDGGCLADVHEALFPCRAPSLFRYCGFAFRLVADASQGIERRGARNPRSALRSRHLVLSLPPAAVLGSAGHGDYPHTALTRRDGRDVLAAERHHAPSAPRLRKAQSGATPRRPLGAVVHSACDT